MAMTQQDRITEDFILHGRPVSSRPSPGLAKEPMRPFKEARDSFDRDYLLQVLELSGGNVSKAAKMAGKYRADFYDLLKKHGISPSDVRRPA